MFYRKGDNQNGIFNKISYKHKIILFIILSVIGVGSIVYDRNKKEVVQIDKTIKNEKQTLELNSKETLKQNEEQKKKENEKIAEETRIKTLDEECQKAYDIFGDKNYEEVIKICDEVIKKDANFYKAYNIKGIALAYNNKYQEGMKNIDKALLIKPDFGYARFNKALAYELYGHYEEALTWYNKALEVEKYVWSYYGIASIYGRRGDASNTVKYLKMAIEISADVKEEAKNEADFNPVRETKEFIELIN